MDNIPVLDDLELDFLNEMFNIGVGNAAASLSQMMNQPILLSVPEVKFLSIDELVQKLGRDELICSVKQDLSGPFNAQSLLIFPEENSLDIIRCLLGSHLSAESLAELQNEAMSEIGNIVLNACIGSMSQILATEFTVELPDFNRSKPEALLSQQYDKQKFVLFISIELTLSESRITGYLAFLLGSESFAKLHNELQKKLSDLS